MQMISKQQFIPSLDPLVEASWLSAQSVLHEVELSSFCNDFLIKYIGSFPKKEKFLWIYISKLFILQANIKVYFTVLALKYIETEFTLAATHNYLKTFGYLLVLAKLLLDIVKDTDRFVTSQ